MKMSDLLEFIESPSKFDVLYQGKSVKYLNEAGPPNADTSRFFVAGFEFGAHVLVHVESYRGDGFEAAWEAWIDSMPTIPDEELPEAYGPQGTPDGSFIDMAHAEARESKTAPFSEEWKAEMATIRERSKAMLDECIAKAQEGGDDYPDLIEGYEQNSSGGVVSLGHYAWMNEADLDDIEIVRKA